MALATKRSSLKQQFLIGTIGQVANAFSPWLLVIVITKLGTPAMVGLFSLAIAISTPIFLLTNLALRELLATDVKEHFTTSEYLRFRFLCTGCGLIIIFFSSFWFVDSLLERVVIWEVGIYKASEAISDLLYGVWQRSGRVDLVGLSLLTRSVLSILVSLCVFYLTRNLSLSLLGVTCIYLILLMVFDRRAVDLSGPSCLATRPIRIYASPLLRLSLLAGAAGFLQAVLVQAPRFFINSFAGRADLGIFAAISTVANTGIAAVATSGQVLGPMIARAYSDSNRVSLLRLIGTIIIGNAAMAMLGYGFATVWGQKALIILYRKEYAAHSDLLNTMMIAAGIGYVMNGLGYVALALRQLRVLVFALVVACVLTLPAYPKVLHGYGLSGAAAVVGCGFGVVVCVLLVSLHRLLKTSFGEDYLDGVSLIGYRP